MEEKIKKYIEGLKKEVKHSENQIETYSKEQYLQMDFDRFMYDKAMVNMNKALIYAYNNVIDDLKAILESEE